MHLGHPKKEKKKKEKIVTLTQTVYLSCLRSQYRLHISSPSCVSFIQLQFKNSLEGEGELHKFLMLKNEKEKKSRIKFSTKINKAQHKYLIKQNKHVCICFPLYFLFSIFYLSNSSNILLT